MYVCGVLYVMSVLCVMCSVCVLCECAASVSVCECGVYVWSVCGVLCVCDV